MTSVSLDSSELGGARNPFGVSVGAPRSALPPRAATARRDVVTTLTPARHVVSSTPALWGSSFPQRRAPFLFPRGVREALAVWLMRLLGSTRRATFACLALLLALQAADAAPLRVAIVTDGPADRALLSADLIEREAAELGGEDVQIVFPADKRFAGDWSLAGANAALERALADGGVDAVLTLGMLASHEAAHRAALPKPVIAPFVADPILQGYPLVSASVSGSVPAPVPGVSAAAVGATAGTSGRRNFSYIADFRGIEDDVRAFHDVVAFEHLVALVDAGLLGALPELAKKAGELESALSIRLTIVPVGADLAAVAAQIPAEADAVYVTGLQRFRDDAIRTLAGALIARRLPSFSVIGKTEIDDGLLLTTGGVERDGERAARRVVLMLERVGRGEDPAAFEVGFPAERRLAINMRTAEAIGFSPQWEFLADAEQLHAPPRAASERLTLLGAMREALAANPALEASRARLDSSADDTRIARSSVLPSLDLSTTRTQIDDDRASPLFQAERTTSADLTLQKIIYSERVWANYAIARALHEADAQGLRQDALDTLESAASAYLDLLRAQSVEQVRRGNVENTRRNLETSRVRETVGVAQRSDYLRWVAQLAQDKQSLLAAESGRRQAETALARILHRAASAPFTTDGSDVEEPLAFVSSPRVRAFLDTPAKWELFMEYVVAQALEQAPEVAQADAVLAGRRRAVTAARRSAFVPDLAIVSNGSSALSRAGAGSATVAGAPDDESWSISLQATLPLFTGRKRAAELSQARHELRASEADRAAATDSVEARARIALQRSAGSFPAIALSREAAAAANENLASVTDAYARGAVSVTELIDAQDAALDAGLAAADAKFGFLIDFVGVLRALSEFEVLLDPPSREAWLEEVDEWVANRAAAGRLPG
jgi:outer membrane protein